MKGWCCLWIVGLVLVSNMVADAKVVKKYISFRGTNIWQYITKYGISIGEGKFTIKARFKSPLTDAEVPQAHSGRYSFKVHFYLDTKWMDALEETKCFEKAKHEIRLEELNVPADGSWSRPVTGGLGQRTRPYVWFVAVSDCHETLHALHPQMPAIEFYLHFTGYDGSEFSHDEIGVLPMYSLAMVLYAVLVSFIVYNYYKDIKKTERIESPIMMLCMTVLLEAAAIFFRWLHLLIFSYNGEGVAAFHIIALMSEVASQFVLSLLLIMLSWGWTVTYLDFYDADTYIPLIVLLLMFHLITAGLTELTNDAYHKYHDYEGIQGILLVVARIGMFIYFIFGMQNTRQKCRAKARPFINFLSVTGSLYMLSFPLLIVISQICAHYVRHKVITLGTVIAQTVATCVLLRMFVGKTMYTEVSKHDDTILPGGKND